ncbi:hypothetical protein Patl1_12640 [Pistacia atlantica]|uniref:Uncharacterized protein n=1 Tax=Pistacia atlantica TaxID=434234 RepID=A0ACC1AS58_9ROSI|nr:hypothetical protein Patl1_12640 [Pistacia atlantica]
MPAASKSSPFTNKGPRSPFDLYQSKARSLFLFPNISDLIEGAELSPQKKPIGDDNYVQQQQFAFLKYPSLLRDPDGCNRYFINLVGITIGQKRLQMPFSNDGSSSQIAIIDSGTLVCRLPPSVYSQLRSSFKELMSIYPPAEPIKPMDTCYNLEGYDQINIIPIVILHFDNDIDLPLDHNSVVLGESNSQVCLAFAEDTETIIDSHQQRNIKIFYDVHDKQVGFSRASGSCSN